MYDLHETLFGSTYDDYLPHVLYITNKKQLEKKEATVSAISPRSVAAYDRKRHNHSSKHEF